MTAPFTSSECPVVEATSPTQAAVDAVIRRLVPVMDGRGEAAYWSMDGPGRTRWPTVQSVDTRPDGHTAVDLGWGEGDHAQTIRLEVVAAEPRA